MKNKKIVYLIYLFAFIIFSYFFYIYAIRGSGKLEVSVFPNDATYKINSSSYKGSQIISLAPGKYSVTFKRKYYKDSDQKIMIEKGKTAKLDLNMLPVDNISELLRSLSESDKYVIDLSLQLENEVEKKKYLEEHPIVDVLPLLDNDFRIDYAITDQNNPNSIVIKINIYQETLKSKSKAVLNKEALEKIKEYNIDPSKIIWTYKSKSEFSQ